MRMWMMVLVLGAASCTATSGDRTVNPPPSPTAAKPVRSMVTAGGSFAGVWEDCDEGASPDQCSRYQLVQRGDRLCGTWSYMATYDLYEGRLAARVTSPTEARRLRVCGRPGSETRTECDAGWESVDKTLRLCEGRLADGAASGSGCRARYKRAPDGELAQLEKQPWMQACLAGDEETTP